MGGTVMAIIDRFEKHGDKKLKAHPTNVVGYFGILERDGRKLLQIDTLGSETRKTRDKLSQTIQLTPESAKELWLILGREFDFSK